jgi:hypothetical protein
VVLEEPRDRQRQLGFAVESMQGDVFPLGNTSYRIQRVERALSVGRASPVPSRNRQSLSVGGGNPVAEVGGSRGARSAWPEGKLKEEVRATGFEPLAPTLAGFLSASGGVPVPDWRLDMCPVSPREAHAAR